MKKGKFNESQIVGLLKEAKAGGVVGEVCRKHGISPATFYLWKAAYAGMSVSHLAQLKRVAGREHEAQAHARWLATITLAGVLPHRGMLPVGLLSFCVHPDHAWFV